MRSFERSLGREKKRHPADILQHKLASQASLINHEAETGHHVEGLLRPDATIDPEGYKAVHSEEIRRADVEFVRKRELDFSGASVPNIQAFYRDQYGAQTQDQIIAQWKKNKSREKNSQMEMAVTALLSEKLGKNFLVVRTAAYDDYKNGVDNLILDRRTGEVVGAFDEVHEGGDGRRTEEKKKKIWKIAEQGGARIRYGITYVGNRLERASLEGIPVFYLGLESSELANLIQGLADNDSAKTDKIFGILLDSLAVQSSELEKSRCPAEFRAKLASFGKVLSEAKETLKTVAA